MTQRIILHLNDLNTNKMTIANYIKEKQIKEKKRLIAKDLSNIGMNEKESINVVDDLFKRAVFKKRKPVKKPTKKQKPVKKPTKKT